MGKEKNENNDYMVIDVRQILEALLARFWVILLAMILCAAIGFCYSTFFVTKMYSSSIMLYVNNSSVSLGNTSLSISASDITASNHLTKTYSVLLKNRTTVQRIIDESGLDYSYSQVMNMISAGAVGETQVMKISVVCEDPYKAQKLAQTIALVFPGIIGEIIDGTSARVVDDAVVNLNKVSPSVSKYTIIGMLIGLVLSAGIIILLTVLDDTIKSEEYVIDTFGYPVLAVIPNLISDASAKKKYQYYYYGYSEHGRHKSKDADATAAGKEGDDSNGSSN